MSVVLGTYSATRCGRRSKKLRAKRGAGCLPRSAGWIRTLIFNIDKGDWILNKKTAEEPINAKKKALEEESKRAGAAQQEEKKDDDDVVDADFTDVNDKK